MEGVVNAGCVRESPHGSRKNITSRIVSIDLDGVSPKAREENTAKETCGQQCCKSLKLVFTGIFRMIHFGVYLYDMVSDVRVSMLYIERGHDWWGYLSIAFFCIAWISQCALAYDNVKPSYAPVNNRLYYGILSDHRVAAAMFLFLPIIQIGWSTIDAVIGRANTSVCIHRRNSAARVKLGEVLLEAFPQITLQTYVIIKYNYILMKEDVDSLQWVSLAMSLASLSVHLSNGFMFQEIRTGNIVLAPGAAGFPYKITWLTLGALTICCRVYICAISGALIGQAMLLIPLLIGAFIAIGIWGLRVYYPCKYWTRAGLRFGDRGGTFEEKAYIVLSWIGTLLGNGFTRTGLVLSVAYLFLSFIPFIHSPNLIYSQLGLGIAAVSTLANVIPLLTSKGQDIAQRWEEGQYKLCRAGQQHWFNGKWRGAEEGEKYYSFRYY